MAGENQEFFIFGWVDDLFRDKLALPPPSDFIPVPGDVARSLFGGKSLDNIGKDLGSRVKSFGSNLPRPPLP